MAMQLGGGVRGEHYPVLLGQLGDAQGLGKAGGSGCVELHITDTALNNEIAYREAGQLALAMRQRDWRIATWPKCRGQRSVIQPRLGNRDRGCAQDAASFRSIFR